MKYFLGLVLLSALAVCFAAEEKKETSAAPAAAPAATAAATDATAAGDRAKTYRRLIPADVLRDFPGMCFASTRCSTIEPGHSWDLAPFCGRSTCVTAEGEHAGRLLELVEDCGPLPKTNPKCKLSAATNKTAPFPDCCPIFECEAGVKLEYPEVATAAPTEAEPAKKAEAKA